MRAFIIIIIIFYVAIKGFTQQPENEKQIVYLGLSELINSTNEVECFSHYYDVKPEIITKKLDKYRCRYMVELTKAGWNAKNADNLIYLMVPFTKEGKLITWDEFKKHQHIDHSTEEKTLFHYPIED